MTKHAASRAGKQYIMDHRCAWGLGIWNDARQNRKGNCGVAAKRELKLDSDPSNVHVGSRDVFVIQLRCELMQLTISAAIATGNCTRGKWSQRLIRG